jgi:hypothetical protein
MTSFSIPSVPITYYDWRLRKVVTIGSPPSASTITANTTYTTALAQVNPSDVVKYALAPIPVNAPTSLTDVAEVGYWWWNPKTQRISRSNNVNDYTSNFSVSALQQTYRVNTDALTDYGNTFAPKIVPYTPLTGGFVPYYTQGKYASAVSSLVMTREEWQALFDSGTEVILSGIGKKITQYGDGVKVIQNSDGTLGIVSDAAGGLQAIEQYIDNNKWFWLTSFPELDDYAIFQASQRLPTLVDLIDTLKQTAPSPKSGTPEAPILSKPPSPNVTLPNSSGLATLPKASNQGLFTLTSPPTLSKVLSPLTLSQTPGDAPSSLREESSPQRNVPLANQGEGPLNPTKWLGLRVEPSSAEMGETLNDALTQQVDAFLRQLNNSGDARRFSLLAQNEGLSITDDPSSMSEDRLVELKKGQGALQGGLSSENDADLLKQEAQRNTPEVRRQKAMQLRYYMDLP